MPIATMRWSGCSSDRKGASIPFRKRFSFARRSAIVEIPVVADDQPNFFVEALTIYDGNFHQEAREIIVPPNNEFLDVAVSASKEAYLPGEEAEVEIAVKGMDGEPVEGSAVLAVYDRSLEQIAPDALPPDIREFFWKWRRQHYPQSFENLSRKTSPIYIVNMPPADPLGIFGASMADDADAMAITIYKRICQKSVRSAFGGSRRSFGGGMGWWCRWKRWR